MDDDILPTSIGIIRCLQALAEETASLGLTRTHLLLQQTIGVCRKEAGVPKHLNAFAARAEIIH